ncbi:RNA-directed DNA polymerase from mobile element jockey [Aphis craccivora]|uniref:RNA-directed DNA polymerase from mobile element jockey n=1 Tax=Aphis craccivora TaxID=307492 RepID=A0A6G0VTP5_APHCR|nr:RNA-directed DNA polymerase from mobile element jockey [Aphis craccivora]
MYNVPVFIPVGRPFRGSLVQSAFFIIVHRCNLSDRVQWVKLLGSKSAVVPVPSGVPQGGHLSPLLFSLFINGITKAVPKCRFLMFADFSEKPNLKLTVSPFRMTMSFTRRRLVIDYSYTINGSVIDRVTSNNNLGVLFSFADLNFRLHIDSICCRALKSLGFVMRTMNEFKLSGSLKTVYCSLVRSMLEASKKALSVVCSLHAKNCPPHDYTPVLRALSLTSLADRRVKANLAFLKKLIDYSLNAPSLLVQVNLKFHIGPQGLEFILLYLSTVPITVKTNKLTA